jgi:ADP-ribosyl-[dinitrogen reductase] hydrolase
MKAGENTLDALVTRELTRSILSQGEVDSDDFRSSYITFLTTPGSHNDTYAGTCHRMFFRNLRDGVAPKDCPDNDSHNVDAIDALMAVPPVALAHHSSSEETRNRAIRAAIQTTRNTEAVLPYAYLYSDMLLSVLNGERLSVAAHTAGQKLGLDLTAQVRRSPDIEKNDPMVACYITSAFPALLFFAYKYGDMGTETLLLASTNAGGENVARGSLLGALIGAKEGLSGLPQNLVSGLQLSVELLSESQQFSDKFGNTNDDL